MPYTFTFREAALEDLTTVCTFPQNATELYFMFPKATYPLTYEQLKSNFEQRSNCTVFLCNDQVVAFCNIYDLEPGRRCTLGNVIIHPSFRGKGVSTFLLNTMAELVKKRYDAHEFHLTCFNSNTPGLLLYTRAGFMPYLMEKRVDHLGDPILAIHMKKLI